MSTPSSYNRDYFEHGVELGLSNYDGFRWIPARSFADAELYASTAKISHGDKVLDFGCAKGFIVRALRERGYQAFGCDWSAYAIANCDRSVKDFCSLVRPSASLPVGLQFDLAIAAHVLEHHSAGTVGSIVERILAVAQQLLVLVPLGNGQRYLASRHEADRTHVIRQPLPWWVRSLMGQGQVTVARELPDHLGRPDLGLILVRRLG